MPARRKPERIKAIQGYPGRKKNPHAGKNDFASTPECPDWLPEAAKEEWNRVVAVLDAANALSALDTSALADYALCVARLRECEADISTRGVLVDGDRGKVKNPALQIARTYRAALQKWCQLFGCTPDARGRMDLKLPKPEPDDPWARLDRMESDALLG